MTEGTSTKAALPLAIGLALSTSLLFLLTAPGVVNLDGLGYLKLLSHNFAAGHLLYMPLLRGATQLLGGDGLKIGRLLNALLGGTGVLLTFDIAWRCAPLRADRRFVATVAAAGLAVSYGYWSEAADLEAYALAMVALLTLMRVALPYRARPSLARAAAIGACLGLAVLTHLTHVLCCFFVLAVCLEDPRGRAKGLRSAALALSIGGALSIGAYAYAAFIVRGHHLEGAVRWLLSASHGFAESAGAYAIAQAIYGLARSFVWSPYLHEADAPRLLGQFLLGLLPLLGLLYLLRRCGRAAAGLPTRLLVALAAPYAAFAVVFFGADPERWIFVLPVLWILGGVLIDALAARRLVAQLLIGGLFVTNLALAIAPARFNTWPRHLAEIAAAPLSDGDLVVFPGHDWDEYVSYYGKRAVEPFPLSYYAARDGEARMWDRLDREVAAARARGHRVFALRVFDEDREVADAPAGYVELRALGLSRAALRAKLAARFVVVPIALPDGVSMVRLDAP